MVQLVNGLFQYVDVMAAAVVAVNFAFVRVYPAY
jgi:hypothetical protein